MNPETDLFLGDVQVSTGSYECSNVHCLFWTRQYNNCGNSVEVNSLVDVLRQSFQSLLSTDAYVTRTN